MAMAKSKVSDHPISESRDIVFSPNQTVSPTFGKVFRWFMSRKGKSGLSSWTCKKTTRPGDLYLFYFGEPKRMVAGLAVCREAPDPKGEKQRGWSNKMFFCPWDEFHHFAKPIAADEIQAAGSLARWWKTRPYHGRPKTIPPEVANSLLRMIAKREPKLRPLLKLYIGNAKPAPSAPKKTARLSALEGTRHELITQQRARSQWLRDEKIRQTMVTQGALVCQVPGCGFDFLETYGEKGRGFAHVHHRRPLAERKKGHTKLRDLAIVCANCHAMIHRGGQCRKLAALIATKK